MRVAGTTPPKAISRGRQKGVRISGDDIRRQGIFNRADLVAKHQLTLFQSLNLDEIRARRCRQSSNGRVEVTVLLLQVRQLLSQRTLFLVRHRYR